MDLDHRQGPKPNALMDPMTMTARGIPDPPTDLAGEALAEWARLSQVLDPIAMTPADRAGLAVLCQNWAMVVQSRGALRAHIDDYGFDNPKVITTLQMIVQRAEYTWMRMASEFGITPKSRGTVKVAPQRTDDGQTTFDFDIATG